MHHSQISIINLPMLEILLITKHLKLLSIQKFENPLKAIDGTTIPISENTVVKNVDKAGNPDQNGGYIKLETTATTLETTVGFSQRVTGIINAANDNPRNL